MEIKKTNNNNNAGNTNSIVLIAKPGPLTSAKDNTDRNYIINRVIVNRGSNVKSLKIFFI